MKAAAISGPLGSTIATRSLRPTPKPFSVVIVSLTSVRSLPKESGGAPGALSAIAASGTAEKRLSSVRLKVMGFLRE